jgi:AraC family transcriptional regulator
MQPKIEVVDAKKLVGFSKRMSLAEDSTAEVWRRLMPRRSEIVNRATTSYISMRIYSKPAMTVEETLALTTEFDKWAAIEVTDWSAVPEGMQRHSLSPGRYAVFVHRGPASEFAATMRFIFGTWLPASAYELDDREHFEVIPEGWNPSSRDAWEEVWVPIRASSPDTITPRPARVPVP